MLFHDNTLYKFTFLIIIMTVIRAPGSCAVCSVAVFEADPSSSVSDDADVALLHPVRCTALEPDAETLQFLLLTALRLH